MLDTTPKILTLLPRLNQQSIDISTCIYPSSGNKKVIYTAIFGTSARLLEPENKDSNYDYICFTDNPKLESDSYTIKCAPRIYASDIQNVSVFKLLSHLFLIDYDISLWVDNNVKIRGNKIDQLLVEFDDHCIMLHQHAKYDCFYQQADVFLGEGKYKESLAAQIQYFREEGFPEQYGLVETGQILRNHQCRAVEQVNEFWWKTYKQYLTDDYLSFNYSIWKCGYFYALMERSQWMDSYFRVISSPLSVQRHLPDVTLIMPVRDQLDVTKLSVSTILDKTKYPNYDLIIIDNDSAQDTKDYLQQLSESHPDISVITNPVNLSFSEACNNAVEYTCAELLCFVNNDIEIRDENWLKYLVSGLLEDDNIGLVAPMLIFPDYKIQSASILFTIEDHGFVRAKENRGFLAGCEVSGITGACMLFRRSIFDEIGRFDERYFYGQEDVDISLSMLEAGYKIKLISDAEVIHHESSTRTINDTTLKNRMRILEKWKDRIYFDFPQIDPVDEERLQAPEIADQQILIVPDYLENTDYIIAESSLRLYSYSALALMDGYDVLIHKAYSLPEPGAADIAFIQTSYHYIDFTALLHWAISWIEEGAKLVVDVSGFCSSSITNLVKNDYQEHSLLLGQLELLTEIADLVLVEDYSIAEKLRADQANIVVIPSYLNDKLWRVGLSRLKGKTVFTKRAGDPVRIGYVSMEADQQDIGFIATAIEKIKEEYGDYVTFEVITDSPLDHSLSGVFTFISLPVKRDILSFINWLHMRINWDVVLLPAGDEGIAFSSFSDGRSKNDFMRFYEYTALRLVCIASDTYTNRQFIRNHGNGLLVKNHAGDWYQSIKILIENKQLRKSLLLEATLDLKDIYSISANLEYYQEQLQALGSFCQNETRLSMNNKSPIEEQAINHVNEKRVDIVIPVYNALEYVKTCILTVLKKRNGFRTHVIVINDGSGEETTQWLRDNASEAADVTLIEHPENRGYTRTINTGLKASDAPYVILLNSDTEVSENWLDKLITCADSSPDIGIVGPLSNAASWQSVPELLDEDGLFKINTLPSTMTVDNMAGLVAQNSLSLYPSIEFVNGFCFLIKREVIDTVGLMDEINFPTGYGEENDYCMRAMQAGYRLVIADDCYIYHAKSKSFGKSERDRLSKIGSEALRRKYGDLFNNRAKDVTSTPELDALRQSLGISLSQSSKPIAPNTCSIIFILPSPGVGGGTHSIVQEVEAMRRFGVTAKVAIKAELMTKVCEQYSGLPNVHELFLGYEEDTLVHQVRHYDVVVGTLFSSMRYVKKIVESYPQILPAYYVQDYEPLFFEEGTDSWQEAKASYELVSGAVLFAKTRWIAEQVIRHHGVYVHKVNPSIDSFIYYPALRKVNDGKIHIAAMIRPRTPRRGPERTMQLLSLLNDNNPGQLLFHLFGCDKEDAAFLQYPKDFDYVAYGILKREGVADVLRKSDIFIDLSDYQAFGRTALEAMACGCTSVVPLEGGANEYAVHNKNALVVDTLDVAACLMEIDTLIKSPERLSEMKKESLLTAVHYTPQKAALSELDVFAKGLEHHHLSSGFSPNFESPGSQVVDTSYVCLFSLHGGDRKDGDSTCKIRGFINPLALKEWHIHILPDNRLPAIENIAIAIIQYRSNYKQSKELQSWINALHEKGGKCILVTDEDESIYSVTNARLMKIKQVTEIGKKTLEVAKLCDSVIVATERQQKLYARHHINTSLLPITLDEKLWRIGQPRPTKRGFFRKHENDPVRIGYIGDQGDHKDLLVIKDAIKRLEHEYGDKIQVEIIGVYQKNLEKAPFGKAVPLPKKKDYSDFINWLQMRIHWDIAVLPVCEGFKSKLSHTHMRFFECTALRMACVCSDHSIYENVVRHGETGLVVNNTEDSWYTAIKQLIEDKATRESLYNNARLELENLMTIKANSGDYYAVLNDVQESSVKIEVQNNKTDEINVLERMQNRLTLSYKRTRKLFRDPYRFFEDSHTPLIKPLKHLFKQKI